MDTYNCTEEVTGAQKTLKKDIIGSAAMGVLGIQIVLDTKERVHDYKVVD